VGARAGAGGGGGVSVMTAIAGPDDAACGGGNSISGRSGGRSAVAVVTGPSRDSPHPSRRLDMLYKCLFSLRLTLHRDGLLLNGVALTKMRLY